MAICISSRAVVAAPEAVVDGYVQAMAVVHDQSSLNELDESTGRPLNEDRFLLRRARLIAMFNGQHAHSRIELDANTVRGSQVRIISALVGIGWPERNPAGWYPAEAQVGLFRTPFGADLQLSSRRRLWAERSHVARALFPGTYDLGVQALGQLGRFRYQIALMNGAPIEASAFPGLDPDRGKDVVGRLGLADVPLVSWLSLDGGVSIAEGRGFSPGVPATKDDLQWRDANENGVVELAELVPLAGQPGRPSQSFSRGALGADLAFRLNVPRIGPARVFAEVFWARNLDRAFLPADPISLGRDLRERGVVVGVTQWLPGAFVVGARYDHYDPDADASEQRARQVVPRDRSVASLSLLLGWAPSRNALLTAQYDRNDNHLGRDAAGNPARLADDRISVLLQVER
ncbi:MAG: hypothetical protein SF187_02110 [Deltaproteobacteria bacterium]|nr:hypothetical protein [Deltaproteobacteria bacterium]